jgi:hypothetical protein
MEIMEAVIAPYSLFKQHTSNRETLWEIILRGTIKANLRQCFFTTHFRRSVSTFMIEIHFQALSIPPNRVHYFSLLSVVRVMMTVVQ